jgi:cytochrome c oxidase subunit 2
VGPIGGTGSRRLLETLGAAAVPALLGGAVMALSGPALAEGTYGAAWRLPDDVSTHGHKIDNLFNIILWITGAVFVLVEATLIALLIKYRKREGRKATYTHGSAKVEIVWTAVPAAVILFLALLSRGLWAELKQDVPDGAMNVKVVAEQFVWNIIYPGSDAMLDTADDVTSINQMHIPIGEPVVVTLTSKDVIHSFFLPEFRLKQDAVPGMASQVWLEATREGTYDIVCAELCGLGHYRMRGFLTVDSPEEFQSWLQEIAEE